ncbi:MAG: HlyD family secretion protein [bacterium]
MEIKDNAAVAAKPGNGNGARKKIIFAALLVFGIAGAVFGTKWFIFRLAYTSTDDAQVDADLIPISSKVPGRIVNIYVSEGEKIRAGQLLARIDPTDYNLALKQAEARLESARRDLEKAQSSLDLTLARNQFGVQQSSTSYDQVTGGVTISSTQQTVNLEKLTKDFERAQINRQRAKEHYVEVQTAADQTQKDLARGEKLFAGGVIAKDQIDRLQTNADAAKSRLDQVAQEKSDAEKQVDLAQSNLRAANIDTLRTGIAVQDKEKAGYALTLSKKQQQDESKIAASTVESLKSQIKGLENAVEQARVALRETDILSPVDGIASKKISMQAEIVPAGKPILFIIDPAGLKITANIEETKLHNFGIGSKARITIDALPGRDFTGSVRSIGTAANSKFALIPSGSASGQFIKTTQRIQAKIFLDGDLSELKPGMNAVVSIKNKK